MAVRQRRSPEPGEVDCLDPSFPRKEITRDMRPDCESCRADREPGGRGPSGATRASTMRRARTKVSILGSTTCSRQSPGSPSACRTRAGWNRSALALGEVREPGVEFTSVDHHAGTALLGLAQARLATFPCDPGREIAQDGGLTYLRGSIQTFEDVPDAWRERLADLRTRKGQAFDQSHPITEGEQPKNGRDP